MVVERSMNSDFLSNTYLVGQEGGAGFFVDAGGPVSPLIAEAERHGIEPTHVLLTHHHGDHVQELGKLLAVLLGIAVGADQHVRRQGREAGGDLPHVQVVHLDDPWRTCERAADVLGSHP